MMGLSREKNRVKSPEFAQNYGGLIFRTQSRLELARGVACQQANGKIKK